MNHCAIVTGQFQYNGRKRYYIYKYTKFMQKSFGKVCHNLNQIQALRGITRSAMYE